MKSKTLLTIFAIILISGCTITNDEVSVSIKKCEANGGLRYISVIGPGVNKTYCENGASFHVD